MAIRFVGLKKGWVFIGIALFLAIATAVMLKNMVSTNSTTKNKVKIDTKEIMVMAITVPAGTVLSSDDVRKVEWPEKYLPASSVFETPADVIGKMVRTDMIVGEPIYKEKLVGDKSRGGLPVLIPQGHRAVAVGVSEIKGVAGFVKPGDKVDVLSTFDVKMPDGKEIKVTKTVLQNVLVMASAQQMIREGDMATQDPDFLKEEAEAEKNKKPDNKKKKSDSDLQKEKKERAKEKKELEKRAKSVASVTLALSPSEAEKLTVAEEAGEIRLVLRSEGDHAMSALSGVSDQEILMAGSDTGSAGSPSWPFPNAQSPAQAAPPAPPLPMGNMAAAVPSRRSRTVELIEGSTKSSVDF
jgi:pilus assembly protein CpaB